MPSTMIIKKSRLATLAIAASAFTMIATSPAYAWPTEQDIATARPNPDGVPDCARATSGAKACFDEFGDWFYITDRYKDGYSAVALWRVKDANGSVMRGGNVWNRDGAGTTRFKNKDLPEEYYVDWASCVGDYATKDILEDACGPMTRIINN
ncbi:MAG: hypothetical protein HOZ81_15305 [Streptomyces sp.]|nr:hypothetical protein [Streptomyces sp.]NUT29178.1 hypothetical protein [Streptomyces sp.]